MKHKALLLLSISLMLTSGGARHALAQTSNRTVVVYQGLIKKDGIPANGSCDMSWRIYDAETNGKLIVQGQVSQVQVKDGLFTLPMDLSSLGDNAIPSEDGMTWWMEHCLRFPMDPICRVMSPRQRVSPTFQALSARVASTVRDGAVTAGKLAAGAVSTPDLQNGAVTAAKIGNNQVVRSINGQRDNVKLEAGEGIAILANPGQLQIAAVRACTDYDQCYWTLSGNAGTEVLGQFLGTTDFDPLIIKVNNNRALRVEPGVTPNLIGGYVGNAVVSPAIGANIGGGGEIASVNTIVESYGTISGGSGHEIHNKALYATIGGGKGNIISTNSRYGVIGGGDRNVIRTNSPYSTIGGGSLSTIEPGAGYSTIGGGASILIRTNSPYSTIGGGRGNAIQTNAPYSTIGGGATNIIQPNAEVATIGGGGGSTIRANADYATIGGGRTNVIHPSAPFATIPGGREAAATNYGQFAYASGRFANNGDAQTSIYVLRTNSYDLLEAEMTLDGMSERMKVPTGGTWTFEILVAARDLAGGNSAGFQVRGVIDNEGGLTQLVPPVPATIIASPFAADGLPANSWRVRVDADNANDALRIKVVGSVALNIRWVASVRTVELIK